MDRRPNVVDVIGSVSARLSNVDPSNFPHGIRGALAEIGQYLDADRVFVEELDEGQFRIVQSWTRHGVTEQLTPKWDAEEFPWLMSELAEHQQVVIPSVAKLPAAAIAERDCYVADGTRSAMCFALRAGDVFLGCLTAQSTRAERAWDARDIALMQVAVPPLASMLFRQRSAKSVRQSEAEYGLLVANSPYCIHQIDLDGCFTSMNQAGLRMRDIDDECDIQGMRYLDVVGDADRARISALLDRARQGEASEFDFTAPSGQKFQSNFVPIFDDRGRVRKLMGLTIDITERETMGRQLRHAHKMEAIGELTGGIAHDFNNLLASILGYLDLARMQPSVRSDSELAHYLEEVHTAGTRASDLVNQLLTFSRKTGNQDAEPIKAEDIIEETVSLLRPMLPSSIELETVIDADVPSIQIMPTQISQALMNLCINARDAMAGSGRLTIHLSLADATSATVYCSSCNHVIVGQYVELSVTDTGAGISVDIGRLFEPFFTSKDPGEGTGMGLAMVHGIVHAHGGHLLVETTKGQGSVFRLLFRAASETKQPSSATKVATDESQEPLSGHVLVVDDEQAVGRLLARMLATRGLSVAVETDGISALRYFQANRERLDLILTDQTMPGMTGAELARNINEQDPSLPIILCTGYSDAVKGSAARDLGVRVVLGKPVRMSDLLREVGRALAARRRRMRRAV